MAHKRKSWMTYIVYIVLFFYGFWMNAYVLFCSGYDFPPATQSMLCQAQCEALCLDNVTNCEQQCLGTSSRHWMTNCNKPNCTGTCSSLFNTFKQSNRYLAPVPTISISQIGQSIELSWQQSSFVSNYTTIYIIEKTRPDPIWQHINSVAVIGWVRSSKYKIEEKELCSPNSYRVMAINHFGSLGFSEPVSIPGLKPGPATNIHYTGSGIYFHKDKLDPTLSKFMAILKWDPPHVWKESEIDHYEWNPMIGRNCSEISHNSLPIFTNMKNQTNHILMTIAANSLGCIFTTQVKAVSKCDTHGPWENFIVDLTNCSSIIGYPCQDQPFDPPGNVENVSISISSTPMSEVLALYKNPVSINPNMQSPLLINIHIHWRPPTDLGSQKIVENYIVRKGRAQRNQFPIPPTFIGTPSFTNVSREVVELIFQLPTQKIPYTYGCQVIAVAPGQVITENELGVYPVYTIKVDRNTSLAPLRREGKVLLDEAGIVILYVNNTLPVHFLFDMPMGRMGNSTIDRYALQWGPLVGPDELKIENKTIVPLNQTILQVYLRHSSKNYGIKVVSLSSEEDDPSDIAWDEAPVLSFDVPYIPGDEIGPDFIHIDEDSAHNPVLLYVLIPVIAVVVMTFVFLRHLYKRKRHFKNLELRLAASQDEVTEDGDHYFVMRAAGTGTQSSEVDDTPTVVPDNWELPHCCLKIGRTIGSGAFGQVVKGRVSKSVLMHRGIDVDGVQVRRGTHITVAIKMLQESTEERYTRDFLNEIQMMKDIGYHRNIVSILGCCTLREPFCLVVEHVQHGDLLSFLRKIRHQIQQSEEESGLYINQDVELFSPHDLLSVARQICTGMEFLSQKGFVHRDLAARNILVGENKVVKIGDFGLARYIYDDIHKIYVNRRGGKLPVKWMSPEAIFDLTFSTASDVWAFGILLFEIVTLGGAPYPVLSNSELLQSLKLGYRMERPDNCCTEIYDVMTWCWNYTPGCRPSFTELREIFTSMLEEGSGLEYFDFKVNEEREYYRINSDEMDPDAVAIEDRENSNIADEIIQGSSNMKVEYKAKSIPSDGRSTFVTEIPDHNCSIEQFLKKKDNISSDEYEYSDKAFVRNISPTSSFHNGLYSEMDNKEIIDEVITSSVGKSQLAGGEIEKSDDGKNYRLSENILQLPSRNVLELDQTSSSSDEVFSDCSQCSKQKTFVSQSNIRSCSECGKTAIHLSPFDLHMVERKDSAICSTNSDELSIRCGHDSESSNSSTISNEYLMPDSPDGLPSKDETNETTLALSTVNDGQIKTFSFDTDWNSEIKNFQRMQEEAVCYDMIHGKDLLVDDEEMLRDISDSKTVAADFRKNYHDFLQQSLTWIDNEPWSIVKTKF